MNILSNLTKIKGSTAKAKRVGRGYGSGKGSHTSTHGIKGQKSRTGNKILTYFEGGQTPITKRLPYIVGFKNKNAKNVLVFNLSDLEALFEKIETLNKEVLVSEGYVMENLVNRYDSIKILGKGKISKKIEFNGFVYSQSAKEKIEKSGGKAN